MPQIPDELAIAKAERDAAREEARAQREAARIGRQEARLLRAYLHDVLITLRFYAEGGKDGGSRAIATSSRVFHPPEENE